MRSLRVLAPLLVIVGVIGALATAPAVARTRDCGYYGRAFTIRATNTTCKTAYHVIRNIHCDDDPCGRTGFSGKYTCRLHVFSQLAGRWTCRWHRRVVSWGVGD
jgi:hypothetical protein